MVVTFTAEPVFGPTAEFGEGPLWDDRDGTLWWTDIPASTVHRYDPTSGVDETIPVALNVGALVPRAGGGLVAATRDGFAVLSRDGGLELIAPVNEDDPSMRM